MALPDAGTKLRMVLDYLPCEACLAQPVDDQDLLCTLCARLDREVAVRVGTRTTVLIERPSAPEAPIVIPPASSMPEAPPAPREILVRWGDEPSPERPGSLEIVVEPLAPLAPAVVPVVAVAEPGPEPVAADEADPFSVDDVAEYVPPVSDYFEFTGRPAERSFAPEPEAQPAPEAFAPPPREPEPEPPAPAAEPEPAPPADDYVFRPPEDEPAVAQAEPAAVEEEILPVEEVVVESSEQAQWAPPADVLPEETPVEPEPAPAPVEEPEEEVLEMEVVEDEEDVVEMEVVEDDQPEPATAPSAAPAAAAPAPASQPSASGTDLYRLRGFDAEAERALLRANITEIQHLSGHDAGELSVRTGVAFDRVLPWIQVADLVHEVGVPVDAAIALVVAGIAGPRALRDADPEEVADRVAAFGGYTVQARDVARWKRRA